MRKWMTRPYANRIYRAYRTGFCSYYKAAFLMLFWPRWN